jgi:hypothetical protein
MPSPDVTRRAALRAAVAATTTAILPGSATAFGAGVAPVRLLVPCYFPVPGGKADWDAVIRAVAPRSEVIAVMNVGAGTTGPKGPAVNGGPLIPANWDQGVTQNHYKAILAAAARARVRVLGYVSTQLGDRHEAHVLADIAEYARRWPGIAGVFLDEGPIGSPDRPDRATQKLGLYRKYRVEVNKQLGLKKQPERRPLVVINFGNVGSRPDQLRDYLAAGDGGPVADVLVMFEGTDLTQYNPPAWVADFLRSRFAVLLHQTAGLPAGWEATLRQKRVGNVYLTDDGADGNPWDRLTKYWKEEVDAVRKMNGGK